MHTHFVKLISDLTKQTHTATSNIILFSYTSQSCVQVKTNDDLPQDELLFDMDKFDVFKDVTTTPMVNFLVRHLIWRMNVAERKYALFYCEIIHNISFNPNFNSL